MRVRIGTGTRPVWHCEPCAVGWSGVPFCWCCGKRGTSGPLGKEAVTSTERVPPDPPVIGWPRL